jgi:hypothetical protein
MHVHVSAPTTTSLVTVAVVAWVGGFGWANGYTHTYAMAADVVSRTLWIRVLVSFFHLEFMCRCFRWLCRFFIDDRRDADAIAWFADVVWTLCLLYVYASMDYEAAAAAAAAPTHGGTIVLLLHTALAVVV